MTTGDETDGDTTVEGAARGDVIAGSEDALGDGTIAAATKVAGGEGTTVEDSEGKVGGRGGKEGATSAAVGVLRTIDEPGNVKSALLLASMSPYHSTHYREY